ncbi:hypothetical protein KQX54_016399 [Cotesia glomerata]|uniref:Uncharacterized protein n=1 Tax=Cotesia glomerata TaxID=32391 RepID=A0AAV7INQ6_COTGL|nr:hypothetical protein KQX54_016399 [Cotesia glomerata]
MNPSEYQKETLEENDNQDGHQFESKTESNSPKDDTTSLNPQSWGQKLCGEFHDFGRCRRFVSRKSAKHRFYEDWMDGVFRPDVILNLNCTYSGPASSSAQRKRQNSLKKVKPLDRLAKRALMGNIVMIMLRQKGWPKNPTRVIYVQLCHNGSVS